MELKQYFLEQVEREAATTRKTLERVPEGRNDWKPHEKSMELGYLASLVSTMLGWVPLMVDRAELNLDAPSSDGFRPKAQVTRDDLLRQLEEATASARRSLEATTEEHLLKPWRFAMGGQTVSSGPRYVMLGDALFSHLAHHRGQLTVYLRLNEAKVPAIYGPSADERF